MARRRRGESDDGLLDLTPMIDVVFQLLIFFLVTFKEPEIIGRLDVFRPAPDPNATPENQVDDMVRLTVLRGNRYMLNQRPMTLVTIERNLENIAKRGTDQTILIQCAEASRHDSLVRLLDLCAKQGLTNLSVVTLPPARR